MSIWKKLFGGSSQAVTPPPSATRPAPVIPPRPIQPTPPPPRPAGKATEPKASCVYVFSSKVLTREERDEAHWGGFFAKHTQVDPCIAEHIQRRGAIIGVDTEWKRGERNLEHAAKLSDAALDGLFDDEHKGGCYLDAILLYPDKPTVFVVMVWNAPVASRARQLIPGIQFGSTK